MIMTTPLPEQMKVNGYEEDLEIVVTREFLEQALHEGCDDYSWNLDIIWNKLIELASENS